MECRRRGRGKGMVWGFLVCDTCLEVLPVRNTRCAAIGKTGWAGVLPPEAGVFQGLREKGRYRGGGGHGAHMFRRQVCFRVWERKGGHRDGAALETHMFSLWVLCLVTWFLQPQNGEWNFPGQRLLSMTECSLQGVCWVLRREDLNWILLSFWEWSGNHSSPSFLDS